MTCSSIFYIIASMTVGAAQTGFYPSDTRSAVVAECEDIRTCDLTEAGLMRQNEMVDVPTRRGAFVIVFVYDAAGGMISGMTITAIDGNRQLATAQTDNSGMAALSVRPGQRYRLQISGPGWTPFTTDSKVPAKDKARLLRVVMRLPPIE